MARIVFKATPGLDLYLVWSTVVDSAVGVGTGAEVVEFLLEGDYSRREALAAVQRADLNGSSAHDAGMRLGWWDSDPIRVMEAAPRDAPPEHFYYLPRARMLGYAHALHVGDDKAAQALLVLQRE